eukprot:TRINITY_DN95450_c0_g1_i1.p1 TRINITY_DN95450_c0_g1~~TRINITY_DN95450_c0_g1_i1.p1  ORF type:complete len:257 (-),score=46.53 TRINITY_DN95450_c0_g1_i1:220-990(-)
MSSVMLKSSFGSQKELVKSRSVCMQSVCKRLTQVVSCCQSVPEFPRRGALMGVLGSAIILLDKVDPSEAAYGDSANVFGKITNQSGFVSYTGEGYAVLLPAKWNPSKEKDFKGVDLRYEDNFDAVNNLTVIKNKTDKTSIKDYGTPEDFLKEVSYLLGQQSYSGQTRSEGGFKENRVSAASLLDVSESKKGGKDYYNYELLVRTADGDEGGRHQLISASVGSDGNLYILKVQCGDKRWFKGAKREALGASESFVVA